MPDLVSDSNDVVTRILGEGAIGMSQAARLCGTFRNGRPTSPSTVSRWANRGVPLPDGRVVKLEAFRLNGRLCTSRAAIIRFINAQQDQDSSGYAPQSVSPGERARRA